MLAELANRDMRRLTVLEPDNDARRALPALTRAPTQLVEQRVARGNQLRRSRRRVERGAASVVPDLD